MNTFGIGTTQQYPLLDPRAARAGRRRYGRDGIPELDYANSLYVPGGRFPARGWVLLRRGDYDNLDPYATNFTLNFADPQTGTQLTFQNLAVVQARCVSRGVAADPNAAYLVELTDGRGILTNEWFQFPTTSAYNVRAIAYQQHFYDFSLNGGLPWTWSTMVGDLWSQMGTFLGAYPGLPVVPSGTPEGFNFPGTACWHALNDVLDLLGVAVSVDLTLAAPYGIVQGGAADAVFAALTAQFAGVLEDDLEYLDAGAGRVPKQVTVLFHRRNRYYATEETVRKDGLQWLGTFAYQTTIAAPAMFAAASGTHYLWDDFEPRYDEDNNILPADMATANALAAQRVTEYYQRVYRATLGFMSRRYTGVLPFATGSQVDGVVWREDFRRDAGFVTELTRGPWPPFPQVEMHTD